MSNNKTKHPQLDKLNGQLPASEKLDNSNSSELVELEKIEGTPFTIVGNEEKGYFLAIGKYRLTEPFKTKDAVVEELATNYWNIILQVATLTVELKVQELQGPLYGKYKVSEEMFNNPNQIKMDLQNPHEYSEENIINKIKTETK